MHTKEVGCDSDRLHCTYFLTTLAWMPASDPTKTVPWNVTRCSWHFRMTLRITSGLCRGPDVAPTHSLSNGKSGAPVDSTARSRKLRILSASACEMALLFSSAKPAGSLPLMISSSSCQGERVVFSARHRARETPRAHLLLPTVAEFARLQKLLCSVRHLDCERCRGQARRR